FIDNVGLLFSLDSLYTIGHSIDLNTLLYWPVLSLMIIILNHKKNVFEFSYEANALLLNQREFDISFLDSFTTKIDAIANRIVSHNYQVIKG
ncbi:MAG: hypothetical protein VW397_04420, partial [Candidatus Margulisiibacteriota bacterium]